MSTWTSATITLIFLTLLVTQVPSASAQLDGDRVDGQAIFTHSLQAPYTHDEFSNEYWDFGGSTIVKVFDHVRLTGDIKSQEGWLYSKNRFTSPAWVIEFEFRIHGALPSLSGDGFAFWYTEDPFKNGRAFGAAEKFKGLGVFFDTYANAKHDHSFPYISAMVNDGSKLYDHDHDNKASLAGHGCEANIRGSEGPLKTRIAYYENNVLELQFSDGGGRGWQKCFTLSDVTLPKSGYIGFSAATGDLHDNHDILRVTTYTQLKNPKYTKNDATDSKVHDDEHATKTHLEGGQASSGGSSWFWTFLTFVFRLVIAAVVLIALYMGVKQYNTKNMKTF